MNTRARVALFYDSTPPGDAPGLVATSDSPPLVYAVADFLRQEQEGRQPNGIEACLAGGRIAALTIILSELAPIRGEDTHPLPEQSKEENEPPC